MRNTSKFDTFCFSICFAIKQPKSYFSIKTLEFFKNNLNIINSKFLIDNLFEKLAL
jgi:hypothetical protein